MHDYRADIDGLRAVAIVPVALFHAGISAFSGGVVSVDVFFVISGLLTTGLIRHKTDAGGFSLASFYPRRVRMGTRDRSTAGLGAIPASHRKHLRSPVALLGIAAIARLAMRRHPRRRRAARLGRATGSTPAWTSRSLLVTARHRSD